MLDILDEELLQDGQRPSKRARTSAPESIADVQQSSLGKAHSVRALTADAAMAQKRQRTIAKADPSASRDEGSGTSNGSSNLSIEPAGDANMIPGMPIAVLAEGIAGVCDSEQSVLQRSR